MLGSCAGLIMLDRAHLGLMDMRAERNAFGRQIRSFEADVELAGIDGRPAAGDLHPRAVDRRARRRRRDPRRVDGHPSPRARASCSRSPSTPSSARTTACTRCCSSWAGDCRAASARPRQLTERPRPGSVRRRRRRRRRTRWSRALQRRPALVDRVFGVLGGDAAADAEQALGAQQVDHHGDVDDEGDHLEDGRAIGQLVDLQRQQRRRHDERQILRPAALIPQADALDALDEAVDEQHAADQMQMRRGRREGVVDLMQQAVSGVRLARRHAALQVRDDFVESVAQRRAVSREQQHEHAERDQHDEVKRAIERDHAQHDLVAQRLAAQRQLDLLALGRMLARGRRRRRERQPAVAAQAAIPARAVRVLARERARPASRSSRGVGADQLVAAHAADQQLPVQPRAKAARRLRAGRLTIHAAHLVIRARRRSAILARMRIAIAADELTGIAGGWPSSSSAADTRRSRTARSAPTSAAIGRGPPRRPPATSPTAAPSRRSSAAGPARARRSPPTRSPRCARRCASTPPRPRARVAGTTPTCSRSACAAPQRPSSWRSSTRGLPREPSAEDEDRANVAHLREIERGLAED